MTRLDRTAMVVAMTTTPAGTVLGTSAPLLDCNLRRYIIRKVADPNGRFTPAAGRGPRYELLKVYLPTPTEGN